MSTIEFCTKTSKLDGGRKRLALSLLNGSEVWNFPHLSNIL